VQSQQLLPKSEVLQEEFFSGAKDGEDPAEQMSKAHQHQVIIAKSAQRWLASKSLILRLCRVLARHRLSGQNGSNSEDTGKSDKHPKTNLRRNQLVDD
jgi:hypothetical protein